ncbi:MULTISPECIES: GIY-YIG nuclease family protein [Dyella]|uniref:GIY-YIG nuclease family protein n=2 Tax=Dyella TaxID=231454 RepID=A0A4R0Z312_9GAMM|nr:MULTISPECIES: GIY-YIG nuclease family protein [Dyella]TBR39708.1 GIY-YIG nuclease family protein [Dyella terrae]TCI12710.1 GIY-YIG nuclease family protein [Dyella soli]
MSKRKITPCVYMLASRPQGTLYIGVTGNLLRRVWEHRTYVADGFTKRYNIHQLVWFEEHPIMMSAIKRETNLKDWRRAWKFQLIQAENPHWEDLYPRLLDDSR